MDTIVPQKRCYKCGIRKPLDCFHANRTKSDGRQNICKTCQYTMKKIRPPSKNYTTEAMRTVGFSRKDYIRVYEQQGGKCAICDKHETSTNQWGVKRLAVDHDHITGEFRGLLCYRCNVKLGLLEDKTFAAAADKYLNTHRDAIYSVRQREKPLQVELFA